MSKDRFIKGHVNRTWGADKIGLSTLIPMTLETTLCRVEIAFAIATYSSMTVLLTVLIVFNTRAIKTACGSENLERREL